MEHTRQDESDDLGEPIAPDAKEDGDERPTLAIDLRSGWVAPYAAAGAP